MQTHLTLCNDSVQDVHQLVWAHFHILHEKYGTSLKKHEETCRDTAVWFS